MSSGVRFASKQPMSLLRYSYDFPLSQIWHEVISEVGRVTQESRLMHNRQKMLDHLRIHHFAGT